MTEAMASFSAAFTRDWTSGLTVKGQFISRFVCVLRMLRDASINDEGQFLLKAFLHLDFPAAIQQPLWVFSAVWWATISATRSRLFVSDPC